MTPDFSAKARELDFAHQNGEPCANCARIAAALREVHDAAIGAAEKAIDPEAISHETCNAFTCLMAAKHFVRALKSGGGT